MVGFRLTLVALSLLTVSISVVTAWCGLFDSNSGHQLLLLPA